MVAGRAHLSKLDRYKGHSGGRPPPGAALKTLAGTFGRARAARVGLGGNIFWHSAAMRIVLPGPRSLGGGNRRMTVSRNAAWSAACSGWAYELTIAARAGAAWPAASWRHAPAAHRQSIPRSSSIVKGCSLLLGSGGGASLYRCQREA